MISQEQCRQCFIINTL